MSLTGFVQTLGSAALGGASLTRVAVSGPVDPDFANVELLLDCDGVDAGTSFTDLSNNSATVSVFGNAQTDTAEKKFGTASLLLDGTDDYLTVPNQPGLAPVDGSDYTMECHIRLNNDAKLQTIMSKRTPGPDEGIILFMGTGENLSLLVNGAGGNAISIVSPTVNFLNDGTWYHVAAVREEVDNSWHLFVDGIEVVSGTEAEAPVDGGGAFHVGRDGTVSTARDWDGHIDNVRVTFDVARYTANFTPPTEAFPTQ